LRATGLGLSIACGIVERHHGRIWVESKVGRGTSFFVGIPIPETAPEM
jgi:signal transduction histidine kinase